MDIQIIEKLRKIQNDRKRWFALGFEYAYEVQPGRLQKQVAMDAGVQNSDISNLRRGIENQFPGPDKFEKIASALGYSSFELIEIGKQLDTHQVIEGEDYSAIAHTPRVKSDASESIQKYLSEQNAKTVDEILIEFMKLPPKKRGLEIVMLAAAKNMITDIRVSHGDRDRSDKSFGPLKRYWDGEITEQELYDESYQFFKRIREKADQLLKEHGLK